MQQYWVRFIELRSAVPLCSAKCRRKYQRYSGHSIALFALTLLPVSAVAQVQPANVEQHVSETRDRVIFDGDAFSSGPTPYWSHGYLISRNIESFSPGTPNVTLYAKKTGSKSAEVAFWFPESQRVVITSAAVGHDGGILASGEADKTDGTRAPFIALANPKGQVTNVIQTQDFYPRNICSAPDGSVWAFGNTMWDSSKDEHLPGNILRRFDFQHGETASHIPRSNFPRRMQLDVLGFIRCTSDTVFAYSSQANIFIKLRYDSETPRIYKVIPPQLMVGGLAVTNSNGVYGLLSDPPNRDGDSGKNGMYFLALDDSNQTAQWQPVKDAVGRRTDEGVVVRVWGADGENLVVHRAGDSAELTALQWVSVAQN
jgi:hypothetical protein